MPSTRSFSPTRQGNPCLVCGNIKGNCRQMPEDLDLCMDLLGLKVDGQSFSAKLSSNIYQKLIGVIESNPDIHSNVSQIPLKRLTRAKNKSLIDQTKEVMSEKMVL
jgi:hypothetical protein